MSEHPATRRCAVLRQCRLEWVVIKLCSDCGDSCGTGWLNIAQLPCLRSLVQVKIEHVSTQLFLIEIWIMWRHWYRALLIAFSHRTQPSTPAGSRQTLCCKKLCPQAQGSPGAGWLTSPKGHQQRDLQCSRSLLNSPSKHSAHCFHVEAPVKNAGHSALNRRQSQ